MGLRRRKHVARASVVPCPVRLVIGEDFYGLFFKRSLITKCPKHVSSIEKETAQGYYTEVFGVIIVVRRIMVTIVVATMAGACISGVRTTYVLCIQLQELIKAVRLLVIR